MKNKKLKSYLYGIRKGVPVLIGFLPVAISYAIAATASGMTAGQTVGMSAAVFAGASQIMATEMIAGGAGSIAIIMTTLVLNLRHIIMSTCVFRKLRAKNLFVRLLVGFGVTDETFAIYTTEDDEKSDEYFMLGLITISYASWVIGALVGVILQRALPESLSQSFGIALYALFIALIVPDIKKSLKLFFTVLLTVGLNIGLSFLIDSSWAIIISTLVGAAFGVLLMEGMPRADREEKKV
ncbi:MAG: AzlC family ABC transporter permease [Clostridia bacterium]|nr:AzlC family ABC transporter permease [Clostridia bacterium]